MYVFFESVCDIHVKTISLPLVFQVLNFYCYVTNFLKFRGFRHMYLLSYGFCGSEVQTWLAGSFCKVAIKVSSRAHISSRGSGGVGSTSELIHVISEIKFSCSCETEGPGLLVAAGQRSLSAS